MAKMKRGTFTQYALKQDASYPEDEEAIEMAFDHMTSLCGNAGQESMLLELVDDFYDWALTILEDESITRGSTWGEFQEMLFEWYGQRADKVQGTDEIWAEGWVMIAEQSGYHDAQDETGEGTGREFV